MQESYLKLKIETRLADDKEGFLRDKRQWEKNLSKLVRQMKQVDREAMQTGRTPMRLGRLAEQGDRASAGKRTGCGAGWAPAACACLCGERRSWRGAVGPITTMRPASSFTCSVCGSVWCPRMLEASIATIARTAFRACMWITAGRSRIIMPGRHGTIGVWVRKNGKWAILHRCASCGKIASNRIAADDNAMLMSIATKPLANPPFPLLG